MNGDLYRLVYYSRNMIVGNGQVLDAAITSILATSRVNNERVGVTGALMFNSGCFGQILEGPLTAVEAVFERIQQDDRHSDVSLLGFDQVPERAFGSWSMGYVGNSPRDADHFSLVGRDSGFDPSTMSGAALFETLLSLAIEEEHLTA